MKHNYYCLSFHLIYQSVLTMFFCLSFSSCFFSPLYLRSCLCSCLCPVCALCTIHSKTPQKSGMIKIERCMGNSMTKGSGNREKRSGYRIRKVGQYLQRKEKDVGKQQRFWLLLSCEELFLIVPTWDREEKNETMTVKREGGSTSSVSGRKEDLCSKLPQLLCRYWDSDGQRRKTTVYHLFHTQIQCMTQETKDLNI